MPDRVLALDLATTTGWAYGPALSAGSSPLFRDRIDEVTSGVVTFERYDGAFFSGVYDWLTNKLDRDPAEVLVYEAPIINQGKRGKKVNIKVTRKLQGMIAVVEMVAFRRSIRYYQVPIQTIKKHGTGNGHADKQMMMKAAQAVGWKPQTDDEADALWLLDYASAILNAAERQTAR